MSLPWALALTFLLCLLPPTVGFAQERVGMLRPAATPEQHAAAPEQEAVASEEEAPASDQETPTPRERGVARLLQTPTSALDGDGVPTPVPAPRWASCQAEGPTADAALERVIRQALGEDVARYGVVAWDLASGTGTSINANRIFNAASLYKLPVMYEVLRQREIGRLQLTDRLKIDDEHLDWDLGTLEAWGALEEEVTLGTLLDASVRLSDNAAAVMLGRHVGWWQADQTMRGVGLCATVIASPDPETTAADMALLLARIGRTEAVSARASALMRTLLLRQTIRDRIPLGVPPGVLVGNKTGNWIDATHDVALVFGPTTTYVLSILSDEAWRNQRIVAVSRAVYDYYHGSDEVLSSTPRLNWLDVRPI